MLPSSEGTDDDDSHSRLESGCFEGAFKRI